MYYVLMLSAWYTLYFITFLLFLKLDTVIIYISAHKKGAVPLLLLSQKKASYYFSVRKSLKKTIIILYKTVFNYLIQL